MPTSCGPCSGSCCTSSSWRWTTWAYTPHFRRQRGGGAPQAVSSSQNQSPESSSGEGQGRTTTRSGSGTGTRPDGTRPGGTAAAAASETSPRPRQAERPTFEARFQVFGAAQPSSALLGSLLAHFTLLLLQALLAAAVLAGVAYIHTGGGSMALSSLLSAGPGGVGGAPAVADVGIMAVAMGAGGVVVLLLLQLLLLVVCAPHGLIDGLTDG